MMYSTHYNVMETRKCLTRKMRNYSNEIIIIYIIKTRN